MLSLNVHGKPVQVKRAWLEIDVVQCGYGQCGQIMATAAVLKQSPWPTDGEIDAAMSGYRCECGTCRHIDG